jgi:hypothetical protein
MTHHKSSTFGTAGVMVITAVIAGIGAAPSASAGLLTNTIWDCTNGDVLEVSLPAAAVSPAAGSTVAPFPGFVTAVDAVGDGQTTPPLGTYVLLGVVGPSATSAVGHKTGLQQEALTCTVEGTSLSVVIGHAGR